MCMALLSIVRFTILLYTVHANPTISTSTPTPCYGDVVTLVCHHPDVASNHGKYLASGPLWRENGVGITPSTGVYLQHNISQDLTQTTLPISITVKHFRNKSFNYSCLLVLAGENGLPTDKVETSEEVTVDPVGEWTVCECKLLVLIIDRFQNCITKRHANGGIPEMLAKNVGIVL